MLDEVDLGKHPVNMGDVDFGQILVFVINGLITQFHRPIVHTHFQRHVGLRVEGGDNAYFAVVLFGIVAHLVGHLQPLLGVLTESEGGQVRPRLVVQILIVGFQTEFHQFAVRIDVSLSFVCVEKGADLFLGFFQSIFELFRCLCCCHAGHADQPYQEGDDSLVHKFLQHSFYLWRQNYEKKLYPPIFPLIFHLSRERLPLLLNYTKMRYADLYNWIILIIFAPVNGKRL